MTVRAMNYIMEHSFPMRATIDVAGCWQMKEFSQFSIVHMLLVCLGQCFGREQ